jgi:hypothetical protein
VAHFFGLHALQALPLFGFLVAIFGPGWLRSSHRVALVWLAGLVYLGLVLLLARGISGFSEQRAEIASARHTGERELLEALLRQGGISPTRTVMETPLSVAEADRCSKSSLRPDTWRCGCVAAASSTPFGNMPGIPALEVRPAEIRERRKNTS